MLYAFRNLVKRFRLSATSIGVGLLTLYAFAFNSCLMAKTTDTFRRVDGPQRMVKRDEVTELADEFRVFAIRQLLKAKA